MKSDHDIITFPVNVALSKLVPASVAQLDAPSDWSPGGRGFNARRGRQHSVVDIFYGHSLPSAD